MRFDNYQTAILVSRAGAAERPAASGRLALAGYVSADRRRILTALFSGSADVVERQADGSAGPVHALPVRRAAGPRAALVRRTALRVQGAGRGLPIAAGVLEAGIRRVPAGGLGSGRRKAADVVEAGRLPLAGAVRGRRALLDGAAAAVDQDARRGVGALPIAGVAHDAAVPSRADRPPMRHAQAGGVAAAAVFDVSPGVDAAALAAVARAVRTARSIVRRRAAEPFVAGEVVDLTRPAAFDAADGIDTETGQTVAVRVARFPQSFVGQTGVGG